MAADLSFYIVMLGLTVYVILDGHGLGVGILTLLERDRDTKMRMTREVVFAWDANESWILLVALALWATLPGATALILPALYLPLYVMLFSLMARGVSIEFLNERQRFGGWPGALFGWGSLVAVFAQGAAIGAVLAGLPAEDGQFSGGTFTWLSGYSFLAGVAAVAVQALSGAVWIRHRATAGYLLAKASTWCRGALPATILLLGATWLLLPPAATRLASADHRTAMITSAGLIGAVALALVGWLVAKPRSGSAHLPVYLLALFKVMGVVGVTALIFPMVVPGALTITQAAADENSIWFFLVAVFLTLPVITIYNVFGYSVFAPRRGARQGRTS